MSEQLSLFKWAKDQSKLTDDGGRCTSCLEEDSWNVIDEYDYVQGYSVTYKCVTPRYCPDTLEFVELCGNEKTINTEYGL